jgi:hypothetical protein
MQWRCEVRFTDEWLVKFSSRDQVPQVAAGRCSRLAGLFSLVSGLKLRVRFPAAPLRKSWARAKSLGQLSFASRSGGSFPVCRQRPGLAALLDYACERDAIVVVGIDRLGRNAAEVS